MNPKDLPDGITKILADFGEHPQESLDQVMALTSEHLRNEARRQLRRMNVDSVTIQPTALINEAYIRLHENKQLAFLDRDHFFWFTSQVLRNIIADYLRGKLSQKRGQGVVLPLDEAMDAHAEGLDPTAFFSINEALDKLEEEDPRRAQVVVLRFFLGLSIKEVAGIMQISKTTVKEEWNAAKLWLFLKLGG